MQVLYPERREGRKGNRPVDEGAWRVGVLVFAEMGLSTKHVKKSQPTWNLTDSCLKLARGNGCKLLR